MTTTNQNTGHDTTSNDREELASLIWTTSRADESTISATGANIVADAVLAAGWEPTGRDHDHAHVTVTVLDPEGDGRFCALVVRDVQRGEMTSPVESKHDVSSDVRAILAAERERVAKAREAVADVLTEHRYLCRSDRGVSPRWEECACGERFTATPDVPSWRLLAEHQAELIARSES